MSKIHSLPAAIVACAALAFGLASAPASSAAGCTSSVPTSNSASDSASDSELGVSPELTALNVSIDGFCRITFSYNVAGQSDLVPGEFYSWFVDSDNDSSTGVASGFKGADYSIGMLDTGYASVMQWNGSSWDSPVQASRTSAFGVTALLDDLGASSGRMIWVAGGASWNNTDTGNTYYDFVPEDSWIGVKPIFPAGSGSGPGAGTTPKRCTVPKVRGLKLAAAKSKIRSRNCKVGKVYKRKNSKYAGRAYKTSPARGANRPAGTKVAIYVGRGGRASSASVDPSAERILALINRISPER